MLDQKSNLLKEIASEYKLKTVPVFYQLLNL